MPPIDDESMNTDEIAGLLVAKPAGSAEDDDSDDDGGNLPAEAGSADDESADDVEDDLTGDEPDDEEDDGSDDAGDGDADDDEGDEAEVSDPQALYPVTIDGKEERVTLKEALAGYQRGADYTRKTQAIAETRTALDGELTAVRERRERFDALLAEAEKQLGPADKEPTPEQWEALKANNPDDYAVAWADFQRRQTAREALKAERQKLRDEQTAENQKKLREYVAGESEKLLKVYPAWKDPEKYKAGAKAIFDYAKSAGFSDQELATAYDHRILVMADKARQWDALQARKAKVREQLHNAPPMPAPGARQKPQNRKVAERKEAQKKFNRTGRVEDAVSLMFK